MVSARALGQGMCSGGRSAPHQLDGHHGGLAPHVRRAASRPSSMQKPGGEGRAALQNPDMQPEATEAHGEEEEGGREKQARAKAVHSLGGGMKRFGVKLV